MGCPRVWGVTSEAETERPRRERKPMTPLQRVAMGTVLIALDTSSGYDLYPDPLGWLLVLWGVSALALPERRVLVGSVWVALAASALMWFPSVKSAVAGEGLSMVWAAGLPDLVFVVLLSRALMAGARREKPVDRTVAARFGVALWGAVLAAVLVPIGDAADADQIVSAGDAAFVLMWIWLVWNLFAVHARAWLTARPSDVS